MLKPKYQDKGRLIYQAAFVFWGALCQKAGQVLLRGSKKAKNERHAKKWLSQIKQAISADDEDELAFLFADLRALQQPKFEALHRVIDELITPTRELI